MKNIKLIPVVLSALVAAPTLVSAQTQNAPVRVAAAQAPMPKAQELLDNLFAPYMAAKTFSGTFNMKVSGDDVLPALSEIHLETRFRYDEKGDLDRENTAIRFVGRDKPRKFQNLRFVNDGHSLHVVAVEQKSWWVSLNADHTSPALVQILKPVLDSAVQALHQAKGAVLVIARGIDGGRPVLILTLKDSNAFRAVVDEKTRALRSFHLLNQVSIVGSNQSFDESMSDAKFAWVAPLKFEQVDEGDVEFPDSLGITLASPADAATPTG